MCTLLFVWISSEGAKCYLIRISDVWLDNLLYMYFSCNRHAMKLYLTPMFLCHSSYYYCQLCAQRKSRWRSVPWSVCVFNLPTLPKVWHFMVQCLFMHCSTRGWPFRKLCAQRLCNGLPTKKTYCHVLFVILCHVCMFSCQINHFQVHGQVCYGCLSVEYM